MKNPHETVALPDHFKLPFRLEVQRGHPNATSVGVVFAAHGFGSGPKAASHFSLRAVDIDELFHSRKHQPLDLRSLRKPRLSFR